MGKTLTAKILGRIFSGMTMAAAQRVLLVLLSLLFIFSVLSAQAAVFYPETFTLANGVEFIVVKNRLSQAVSQMVWYKAGAADEEQGHSGLAHYLEHLMFRGTEAIPGSGFSRIIAAYGGQDNAFTSYDYTAYYVNIAKERLGMIMQMEADRMQNLRIDPETADVELKVVLTERQERIDNNPKGFFAEKMHASLFPGHPYGKPVIGWKNELEKTTAGHARDFHEKHYAPENAVVIISGDVELKEVMRLAAGTYGRLPRRGNAKPRSRHIPESPYPAEKKVVMQDARIQQPRVNILIAAPSYKSGKRKEAYALEVLTEVLGGGEVGELYKRLVVDRKIASFIGVDYDPDVRGPAVFSIAAAPQPGKDAPGLEKAIEEELKLLAQRGLRRMVVNDAKGRLVREAVFARDSLAFPGYAFGQAIASGQTIEDVESWPERISAVTVQEVNESLRKLLSSGRRVTGLLLPNTDIYSSPGKDGQ